MFADEIWVFGPSISGLQCLLNICGEYAAEQEIAFTCNKLNGVLLVPKIINNPFHQMFLLMVYVYNFLTKWNILVYR